MTSQKDGRRGRDRTACTPCRNAKVRCDDTRPCNRCNRLGLECQLDGTCNSSRRRRARDQRKLSQQLQTPCLGEPLINGGHTEFLVDSNGTETIYTANRLKLTHLEAEQMFSVYFAKYHPYAPLVDPNKTPHEYHETSQFLFWTIVSVVSRGHHDGDRFLSELSPFFASIIGRLVLGGRGNNVEMWDVQALILLSLWPCMNVYWWTDRSWIMCKLAMTLGMQIGLHYPISGREYSVNIKEAQYGSINERVRTWCMCESVAENLGSDFGIFSPLPANDTAFSELYDEGGVIDLPEGLQHYRLIQRAVHMTVAAFKVPDQSDQHFTYSETLAEKLPGCERYFQPLKSLMRMSLFNRMNLAAAQLYVRCLYFQIECTHATRSQGILLAYSSATEIVDAAMCGSGSQDLLYYAPLTVTRMLTTAAVVIFKVLFSNFRSEVSYETGKILYNAAASCMSHQALRFREQDTPIRFHDGLRRLWDYGEKNPGLLHAPPRLSIRTRRGASIFYDFLALIREPKQPTPSDSLDQPEVQEIYANEPFDGIGTFSDFFDNGQLGFDWADSNSFNAMVYDTT